MKHNEATLKPGVASIGFAWMFRILFLVALIFTIVVVKQKSINIGYDISRLSSTIENKEITFQSLQERYDALVDKERLYRKAEEMGLKFPDNTKVYYVE